MDDRYKITFGTWDKVASLYQDKFMDLDLYNDTYDAFCCLVMKERAKILEIGCGPGNITRYLLSKRSDFKINAIDVSPNMVALARKNNPQAEFNVMDCREMDTITEKYDAVICGFCMPYLSKDDCAKLIKDAAFLLDEDGIIYCSMIEGDYKESGYEAGSSGDKAFVYYHQQDYMEKIFRKNKFEIVDCMRKSYKKTESVMSVHLIFIARKK